MKRFLLILFSIVRLPLLGQLDSDSVLQEIINTQSYSDLLAYTYAVPSCDTKTSVSVRLQDSVVYSYISIDFKSRKKDSSYSFLIIRQEDKILSADYVKTIDSISSKLSAPVSDSLILCFRNKTIKTADNYSKLRHELIYGTSCGYIGATPPQRILMDSLVNKLDIITLERWLISGHPEIQAYGVEGFYMLKQRGHKLSNKQQALIEAIQNQKVSFVNTCYGCLFESISIQEAIKDFKF